MSAIPLSLFEEHPTQIHAKPRPFRTVGGRLLVPTVAFDTYWRLAAERQNIFFRRLRGDLVLTRDPILKGHRFTNAYRAADRTSQFFLSNVAAQNGPDARDIVLRTLLFKIFNKIETWQEIERQLEVPIKWASLPWDHLNQILTRMIECGQPIYSNAYMMPNPAFGAPAKHSNHLTLIYKLISEGFAENLEQAQTLKSVYELFLSVPSFGPFLAFQYSIDLNYTQLLNFDESEFVVAGPGALSGISKCFEDLGGYEPSEIIQIMADIAERKFKELELEFHSLWGRPLQLIDCQNLFCEVDKYSRVAHPSLIVKGGRSRIKQRFQPSQTPIPRYTFPARWNIVPTGSIDPSRLDV